MLQTFRSYQLAVQFYRIAKGIVIFPSKNGE